MKKLLLLFVLFTITNSLYSQDSIPLATNQKDHAVVYLVRTNSLGFIMNSRIFVNGDYMGKFHFNEYLKLYLKPGKHVISAKAENLVVMEAQLETGKVYVVDAVARLGAFSAGVNLIPVSETDEKRFNKVRKRLSKSKLRTFNKAELKEKTQEFQEIIRDASKKYYKKKKKGKEIPVLNEPVDEDVLLTYEES